MSRNFLGPAPIAVGGKAPFSFNMTIPGALLVGAGTVQLPVWRTITVVNVRVRMGTAPTGANAIFDVNKNGTTIFTTQGNRPTVVAAAQEDLASVPDVTAFAAGDYITVDVDQVGSTITGADAVIIIEYE